MIRQYVTSENKVHFSYYRQGHFFYAVRNMEDGELYCFPVPIEDIGTATLNHEEKSITFMRWIRKALMDGTMLRENCSV